MIMSSIASMYVCMYVRMYNPLRVLLRKKVRMYQFPDTNNSGKGNTLKCIIIETRTDSVVVIFNGFGPCSCSDHASRTSF
jgi:hypothetical protein